RSMKRLVNAYGFHQSAHFLEGRKVTTVALARWTIVELRWPVVTEMLAAQPHMIAELAAETLPADSKMPADLRALAGSPELRRVLTGDDDGLGSALDEATVRDITGPPA